MEITRGTAFSLNVCELKEQAIGALVLCNYNYSSMTAPNAKSRRQFITSTFVLSITFRRPSLAPSKQLFRVEIPNTFTKLGLIGSN